MEKLKSVSELAAGIKDERFLALFSAFVKALDSKDYKITKKLTVLRYFIGKFEKNNFEFGLKFAYKIVLNVLEERDCFYWERKLLSENL